MKILLLPFPMTYVYEARFSSYTSNKMFYNRLNKEADMRMQLSSIKPDMRDLQSYKRMLYLEKQLFYFYHFN